MKKIMLAAFKFLLLTSLLLLIATATFGLVLWAKWPWWIGLFFLLGYVGLYLGWIFFRKILLRKREQNFVHQVIEQDNAYIKGAGSGQEGLQELQGRWQEAIEILKSSHLSKQGNPLYVLPWYMVIGESRSGKSTAIKSADLSAPFAETSKIGGVAGTRNCDWWFFEQAVILDTAGRYTIPLEEGRDKDEWQKFLSLLVKYRRKEPLNGLVVTIAADKLLQADDDRIAEDGRNIRQRIDELMRVLGKVFPVYVLITKCDLVQGMTQFCDRLPDKSLEQAMGLINRNHKDIRTFLQDVDSTIGDRLQQLRLQLLHGKQDPSRKQSQSAADLLLFPNEFKILHRRLSSFIESTFKANPYQESPILRGLYFSSGRQEGTPFSNFLHALGLIKQQDVLPGTNKGLFLHDLFSRILPEDRTLFAPTQKALAWNRLTRNIGLTAWAAIIFTLCGLLSFSFVKNLTTLQNGTEAFKQSVVLQGDFLTDTALMERFQKAISTMEDYNRAWWIPRFGLNKSEDIELRLKQKYCHRFNSEFNERLNIQLDTAVSALTPGSSDVIIGTVVAHLVHRINLIQARLDNKDPSSFDQQAQPSFQALFGGEDRRLIADLSDRVLLQYHHYLNWQESSETLNLEKERLQRALLHILSMPDTSLNWLVSWVNHNSDSSALNVQDFWSSPLTRKNIATVPPAFTIKGRDIINTLLEDIGTALPDPLLITSNKARFQKWYEMAYRLVWYDFAEKFPQAEYYLGDGSSWQEVATTMATDQNPYFSLLRTMARELAPLEEDEKENTWILLINQIEQARIDATREAAIEESNSLLAKVTKKGKKALGSLEKKTGLDPSGILSSQLAAGKLFNSYQMALKDITLASSSRTVSYSMAAEIFKDDPATSKSPFYLAKHHLVAFRKELSQPGQQQKVVWRLLAGPLTFLRDYTCLEAACHLNSLWEKNVLVEVQDITDKTKLNDELFLDDGYAIRFIKGPAAPFLGRSLKKGFYPKTALGKMLPFEKEFLDFLTDGIRLVRFKPDLSFSEEVPLDMQLEADAVFGAQPEKKKEPEIPPLPTINANYDILVTANPTSVNKEARITPHVTTLESVCGAETTRLVNLNYPIRKKMSWQPENCESVSLQIEIGSLILKKKYEGKLAFAHFAKDFQNGSHLFSVNDFPDQKKQLVRLRITTIKVNFQLKGGQPLISIIDQQEKREKFLAELEEKRKMQAADSSKGIKELLATWERKQKMTALENEALKKSWKARQQAEAQKIKQNWEQKLPDVPTDITNCWDN
ncbi:hypothetical protein UWK_02707 [Desulfocapsa sulfexigens DSM 10523]|uniref:Type VI secretion system component TssM1 N-terminal domain-containing protein n=1 Tax=Desulfocapsa sulfexigens (strain DSM 10523 / SB164P1) TaxID=1167006 RepID=M1P6Z5_DESSD|nr:type VI secretion protein IcmF/TssM N-terminal domain-containing protein [Desulfocapsa sulfexigens]AGF79243.1 hypothetical protein UWK_02707 [Desulfocapsa sulfexigens DSM 10523]